MGGQGQRQLRLPASRASVALARAELRDLLEEAGHAEWIDTSELALSELVTNAIVHAGTEVELALRVHDDHLRGEIADGSPHAPVRRDYSPLAGTGRGLHLVHELVDAWGVEPHAGGKVVWFEVGSPPRADAERDAGADPTRTVLPGARTGDVVRVELRNFPTVMHAAWQEHAASLLRERLLVGDEPDEDGTVLVAHACASDAMNLLFEQAPRQPAVELPEQIMVSATEPHVSVELLEITMPLASLAHFDALDTMLEEAAVLADGGAMLVQPTQPEVRAFRRWLCSEVRRQAVDGGSPRPWSATLRPHPRDHGAELDWDRTPVTTSPRALLAADDAGHVVAVSQAALHLLGYADDDQICGQRLLHVVPTRYHQAHIAGVTQHLTNGRSPLLGTPITVPVLRADGSEVDLDLLVESVPLPGGRRVFVAELAAAGAMAPRDLGGGRLSY